MALSILKILIVAPAWLGDMVMAHTLVRALKARHPEAVFAVLAPKSTLAITELMPEFTMRFLLEEGHGEFSLKTRWRLAKEIRAHRFDVAYVLPNTLKSALIPFLAGIPKRVGWKGEGRYILLNDLRKKVKTYPLMVERYVALAYSQGQFKPGAAFPCPRLVVSEALKEQTRAKWFQDSPLYESDKILVLSPGAAFGPAKRWPATHFAAVATAKLNEGFQVWMIGAKPDLEHAEAIMALEPRIRNFVGETTLLEMAALLSLGGQVLCNDSGPMHIAASLGKPLVAIFGSSSPGFTPPLGTKVCILEKNDLACRPCFQRTCRFGHYACLQDILPNQVLEALAHENSAH